jgi:glycosyltransferase involved in cell wall biosynthesis
VLAANSAWNILNFRSGLIRGLMQHGYDPVVIAPADSAADQRIATLGVEWLRVDVDRSGLNPVADLRLLAGYRRILKQVRPLAFLGFTAKPNIYGCLAARTTATVAIPNISGLGTAFMRKGPLQAIVSGLYRLALAGASTIFFQNPDDRKLFIDRRLVRPERARLLPGSGVDLDRFPAAPLDAAALQFLFVGRLLGDKGVREFVDGARIVRTRHPDARFRFLGPLDEGNRTAIRQSELEAWVKEGTIEYIGQADDVRPYLVEATAVVLPSYREGLPRTLLEAAAIARPLIATDVPGCRELVEEGINGFRCRSRDAASLAEAMERLAHLSAGERRTMGNASRQMVEERFSEEFVIEAYLDALGKLQASRS